MTVSPTATRSRRRTLRAAFVVTATVTAGCNHGNEPKDPDHSISANPPATLTSEPEQVATSEPEATSATPPPSGQVPEPPPDIHKNPPAPRPDWGSYQTQLNPRTKAGRMIKRAYQGDGCFYDGDFPKGERPPPGKSPPQMKVDCPAALKDPAFDSCRGGTLSTNADQSSCACFHTGNPPPPPQLNPCPKSPK